MNFKYNILLLVVMASFLVVGCKYDWIIPEEIPIIDPDDPAQQVSFAQEILPIFSGKNCTACHDGSPAPDLRAATAYNSVNTARFINTETPEESTLYTVPHPSGSHPVKYSAAQAALILAWIQQGAKNN